MAYRSSFLNRQVNKMAMSLQRSCVFARKLQSAVFQGYVSNITRTFHKSLAFRSPDVCLSPDKSMILCWHPEPDFPYEYTKPIPRDKTELEEGDSVLKVQYLLDEKMKIRPDGPTIAELSQLLHTPRFTFRRRQRHEKKTEMIKYKPKDREGL